MKSYAVWVEGFAATGDRGYAQFLGVEVANSFPEACRKALVREKWDMGTYYNPETNTYWGCRFYDNEEQARRSYG